MSAELAFMSAVELAQKLGNADELYHAAHRLANDVRRLEFAIWACLTKGRD